MKVQVVPVTAFQQNCSVVWCERTRRAAVVDPGGDIERVLAVVVRNGLTLEKILLTHAHLDHAAATAELARRESLPIEGPHEGDLFWIEQMPAQAKMFGFPPSECFTPNRWLSQDDRVTVGEVEFEVRHCPGHTPGHVVFFQRDARFAIVGDVIFAGSVGRSDLPRGNGAQLVQSIRENLFPLGDDVTFLPGHGPTSTFGAERRNNPFVADRLFAAAR
jgi:glyoxylase-like metal-dependent hydrolase (beta-lactamase superfamily II)